MSYTKLLASSAFIVLNKQLMQTVGIYGNIMLGELAHMQEKADTMGKTTEDGYFTVTADELEFATTLTRYQQTEGINKLVELGILETRMAGAPARKYYRMCEGGFQTLFSKVFKTSVQNFANHTNINNNKNINKNTKGKTPKVLKTDELFAGSVFDSNAKLLFSNTPLNDQIIFATHFKAEAELGIDVLYYYHTVRDWSTAKNEKRTTKGWAATVRNFMRSDKQKGKLVLIGQGQQNAGAIDYLNM